MDRPKRDCREYGGWQAMTTPSRCAAQTIRIAVVAIGHLVALFCPASADPAETAGRAVIAQLCKAAELLAFLAISWPLSS
jgi:hypothetical protein